VHLGRLDAAIAFSTRSTSHVLHSPISNGSCANARNLAAGHGGGGRLASLRRYWANGFYSRAFVHDRPAQLEIGNGAMQVEVMRMQAASPQRSLPRTGPQTYPALGKGAGSPRFSVEIVGTGGGIRLSPTPQPRDDVGYVCGRCRRGCTSVRRKRPSPLVFPWPLLSLPSNSKG
jgi:hypothetical protein